MAAYKKSRFSRQSAYSCGVFMMGYIQGFCASIFCNGVLRESNVDSVRTVRLPFGSEYKILLKNTNDVRAKVQILIDGMDISSVGNFVLQPGDTPQIERFVDNLAAGRKFKFISREEGAATGALQDPTAENLGYIEVRFWKEKKRKPIVSYNSTGILRSMSKSAPTATYASGTVTNTGSFDSQFLNATMDTQEAIMSSASVGGTAEGSHSGQQFQLTEDFETERTPTIIQIRLLAPEIPVRKSFEVRGGWVVKIPENIPLTNTFRVENGELWGKLS